MTSVRQTSAASTPRVLHSSVVRIPAVAIFLIQASRACRILAGLELSTLQRLLSTARIVHLNAGEILSRAEDPIEFCFFPIDSVITMMSGLEDGRSVEVGMIGREGMTGTSILLGGNTTPHSATVQISGRAIRLHASGIALEFRRGGSFHDASLSYIGCFLRQVTQSAACNRAHLLPQRLCRWILNTRDRLCKEELDITHELVSHMLGADRADVSRALRVLSNQQIVNVCRGKLTLLNRPALERAACECYRIARCETRPRILPQAVHAQAVHAQAVHA